MFDVQSLVKYLLEGAAVAVAAYLIPKKTLNWQEIVVIALTAAAVFAVLDRFAPAIAAGARQGSGFGIGMNTVTGLEGFDDGEAEQVELTCTYDLKEEEEMEKELDAEPEDKDDIDDEDDGEDKVEGFQGW